MRDPQKPRASTDEGSEPAAADASDEQPEPDVPAGTDDYEPL
ncbi:hypothetical protein ACWGID_32200 [Kribbella sp. NPDC054772]